MPVLDLDEYPSTVLGALHYFSDYAPLNSSIALCDNVAEFLVATNSDSMISEPVRELHDAVIRLLDDSSYLYHLQVSDGLVTPAFPVYDASESGNSFTQYRCHFEAKTLWTGNQRVLRQLLIADLINLLD